VVVADELSQELSEVPQDRSTQIVTISTDNILVSNDFRASVGAQWVFLSDAGRKVQKDLDIQEYTDPHNNPMIPHTLVLKPGLVIHSIYNGYWYWGRPSSTYGAIFATMACDGQTELSLCPQFVIHNLPDRGSHGSGVLAL
jgi:peroxiredoxin